MLELLTSRMPLDSSKPRTEQSPIRWATPQRHDIDALAKMVDPALRGLYPAKSLSRFADVIALCVQILLGVILAIPPFNYLVNLAISKIAPALIAGNSLVFKPPTQIFCAKCKLRDAFPKNDIILCDGTCNCVFHQKCLEPPLPTENRTVKEAIETLRSNNVNAFVLDLRDNSGGLFPEGIEIAKIWLKKGVIAYICDSLGVRDIYETDGSNAIATSEPLAVLVNKGTVSASEILAGALKDNKHAVLFGEPTFGKGKIQSVFELSDGSGLAVTVTRYETPTHTDIDKVSHCLTIFKSRFYLFIELLMDFDGVTPTILVGHSPVNSLPATRLAPQTINISTTIKVVMEIKAEGGLVESMVRV